MLTNEEQEAVDRLTADKESVDAILAGRPDKTQTSPSRRFWRDVTLILAALAEIARHEAELRAKIVAELEAEYGKYDGSDYDRGWDAAINECIEIVKGDIK